VNKNGFSKEAKDLIGKYEAAGWEFRLSSKGHAIGHAPNDYPLTCSVPRKMLNARADKNCLADYERNMREQDCYRRFAAISPKGQEEMRQNVSPLSNPSDETIARGLDKAARELLLTEARIESDAMTDYAMEALTAPEEKRPHSATALAIGITVQGKFRIVAYECLKCEQRFDKARSVGQHSRTCNGQGNVAQTNGKPDGSPRLTKDAPKHTPDKPVEHLRVVPSVESGDVPALEQDIPARTPDMPDLSIPKFEQQDETKALDQIRKIVAPDLLAEIAGLTMENEALRTRLAKVVNDLEAIQNLVGDIRKEGTA